MNVLQVALLKRLARANVEGFTLIELLVVVLIIGILAAIAAPSLLSPVNRARQSEGLQYVSAINEAQKRYRLDNGVFSASLAELDIGINSETTAFRYSVTSTNPGVSATVTAEPLQNQGWVAGRTFVEGEQVFTVLCRGEAGTPIPSIESVTEVAECPP